ncbi:unnamed protein product, partial [Didymodactylos carnosus]
MDTPRNESGEQAIHRPNLVIKRWRKIAKMIKKNDPEEDSEEEEPQLNVNPPPVMDTKHRFFIGKDYANAYDKDFELLDKFNEDFIDRKKVVRMPWHDEALVVFGEVARDAARHFIQRWNIHKSEKFKYDDSYPFLLPKTYSDKDELSVKNWKKFLDSKPFQVNAQFVRSVGPWSCGTKTIEASIQNAYIQLIGEAQHFIYIENQFFITGENSQIHNQIGDALYQRILQAHTCNEKFRVYIILPLLPGFNTQNAVFAVLYFIMCSITKGDKSLYRKLEKAGVPPDDYISFFGMRAHDVLMGELVQEIIYVHSKLMIVDDKKLICGSANINDRSLLGHRDSEVGVVIYDLEEEETIFNEKTVQVGKFCSSWRRRLFKMMLGIQYDNPENINVDDPVSDKFYYEFRDIARKNTLIYEEVFWTLPTDRVRKLCQVSSYNSQPKLKDTDPYK